VPLRQSVLLANVERYPPRAHDGLGEAGRGADWNRSINSLGAMLLYAFRDRRGNAIERLQFLPLRDLFNYDSFILAPDVGH
jgi:hypothetical protein